MHVNKEELRRPEPQRLKKWIKPTLTEYGNIRKLTASTVGSCLHKHPSR